MERLECVGRIVPVSSKEVVFSKVGLGLEKLDRAVFDPEKTYDRIAECGVKWVRIQSGWARTERERGVFDFAWLDSIVENLVARNLQPWMCLCYGNGLYDAAAAEVFGAVGCPPIKTAEQKAAWARYVGAVVERYRGRVEWFEVWNEPDGPWCWKHGPNGTEYGEFLKATARVVHAANPEAKVIGGSVCLRDMKWFSEVADTGALKEIEAITYHEYTEDETLCFSRCRMFRAICEAHNPAIKIIQGESGSQSRSDGAGALSRMAWTPLKQAKQVLRHTMADLLCGVEFLSVFTCVDMIEALNGSVHDKASYLDYGYFGILSATFDENGFSTGEYTPKPSYYALQNLAAIFRETVELANLPILGHVYDSVRVHVDTNPEELIYGGFRKPNGASAFVYWKASPLLTTTFEGTTSWQVVGIEGTPRVVDMLSGKVYAIPEKMIRKEGPHCYTLLNMPVLDYPLLITFGEFA